MITSNSIQTEVDAAYLYEKLAASESDPTMAIVFRRMSEIENSHALAFCKKQSTDKPFVLPQPSLRARTLNRIGKIFGYHYVLGVLMDLEKSLSSSTIAIKKKNKAEVTGNETNHVKILQSLMEKGIKVSGHHLAKFEKRHRSVGGNALRAAVLGGNDGLVSNFSLVMGIAGATSGENGVLLAGIAGLLAGALSMALGEWISVKSSQELNENQMQLEMDELEANPEGEKKELALLYMTKGIPEVQALQMAENIMENKEKAYEVLVREELGINVEELKGSAIEAAGYSFLLFSIGAIIPVIPFIITTGFRAIAFSAILSGLGLFFIGAVITLFTNKNIWYSGFRQVLFGMVAAAITFAIGHFIGVSVTG
jgi:VIT1/CCC1 family predicted Fe2+/Mn2+ transporter